VAALEISGVTKHFAGTPALTDVRMSVRQGTVHALLGGNGSGKSTLIKCLTGVHAADRGQVTLLGRTWAAAEITARRVHEAGLRVVHQDLGLFEQMTVAENFAFDTGFPRGRLRGIHWSRLYQRVAELLEQYEVAARPWTLVGELSPPAKTMIAVARALQDQRGSEYVLLLDEPTARLPDHEAHILMDALRQRARLGQTIVLVSHNLREIIHTAEDFTVLRDGRVAGTIRDRTPHEDELIGLIAGQVMSPPDSGSRNTAGDVLLDVRDVHAGPLRGLNLTVRRGEVAGLAGLVGSGRSTALGTVFGLRPAAAGSISVGGVPLPPGDIAAAMGSGVVMVPEDRPRDAAFATMSVRENLSVSVLASYWRAWMRIRRERRDARELTSRFAVRSAGVDVPFATLSGGNQQKVVLARWLRREPRLLLLDEPTQGVDVVARTDIYRSIRAAAAAGCGVLIASSDFDELALLCDRVLVLHRGRVTAEVPATALSADAITQAVLSEVRA
jgi:ribose transport system ATP-binding protein